MQGIDIMSFTVADWIGLLSLGGGMLGVVGGLLIRYINQRTGDNRAYFEKELNETDGKVSGMRAMLELYRQQFQEHQIEVAKNYVRNEHLKESEGRILARFDRLEAKMDRQMIERN